MNCRRPSKDFLILSALILLGAILRLDFLCANHFVIDSDEAIVGLMGKHILEGKSFPIFYYGQHYMGSFEALTAALMFKALGISSAALKCVPLLFSLLLIWVVYRLGYECGGRKVAFAAALLIAVPPSALVIWSAMARGGFIEIVLIGALALLFTVRWLKKEQLSHGPLFGVGLLLGFGWWVNNQILYTFIPVGIAVVARAFDIRGSFFAKCSAALTFAAVLAFGALLGSTPFWIYNFTHDFASFGLFKRVGLTQAIGHLEGVFSTALPILFGAKRFWGAREVYPGALTLVYSVYGLLAVVYIFKRRKELSNLLILRVNRHEPLELFSLFVVAAICVFALSSFGYLVEAPRYLLPLYPAVALLLGWSLVSLSSVHAVLFPLGLAVLLALNLASSYWGARAIPGEPFVFAGERAAKDHQELIAWLKSRGDRLVATNYWIGYRLAFETSEEVIFKLIHEPGQVRIPAYEEEAARVPFEEIPQILTPAQAALVKRALPHLCYQYKEAALSGYVVLFDFKRTVQAEAALDLRDASLAASSNFEAARAAVDGDVSTRWGSAKPQTPGMEFLVRFKRPQIVSALSLDLGQWRSDFPRALRVELEDSKGVRRQVLSPSDTSAIRYFWEQRSKIAACIPPQKASALVLKQEGKDPVFDWSIAEMTVFGEPGRGSAKRQ